jgi:hypothetical protein
MERALLYRALGERDLARSLEAHMRSMRRLKEMKHAGHSGWEAWRRFFEEARSPARRYESVCGWWFAAELWNEQFVCSFMSDLSYQSQL